MVQADEAEAAADLGQVLVAVHRQERHLERELVPGLERGLEPEPENKLEPSWWLLVR